MFFSAHTLNLLATTDIAQVDGWNCGRRQPFSEAAAKAQVLWNLQNRSTVKAARIKEIIGCKLKTPCATR